MIITWHFLFYGATKKLCFVDNIRFLCYTKVVREAEIFLKQRKTMLYIIVISAAAVLTALLDFLLGGRMTFLSFGESLLFTVLAIVAIIAIDGVVAFVIRRLPEKWFAPEAKFFSVGKREREVYRRLGVNRWKKYVPELGCFTGFHKDKIYEPTSSEYIGRFLLESNYGALGHILGSLLGALILLIPRVNSLAIALPVILVNFILSNLPTMILRYNTPPLRRLYRRAMDREARLSAKEKAEGGEEMGENE